MTSEPASTKPKSFLKDNIQPVLIALVIALVIRVWIAEPRYIPSDSMLPTLLPGDRLVVEKVSYHLHPPESGDVVVFHPPEQLQQVGYSADQAFIKRVIATEGSTVAVSQGKVYVDGKPQDEEYILQPPSYELLPVTVPMGQLFVMGDNRNNSNDSHVWGFLPQEQVIGKAIFRFWPWNRLGGLETKNPHLENPEMMETTVPL